MKQVNLFILTTCLIIFGGKLFAQDAKFQSLIIYNFTKLLDWPDKTGNFIIKIVGNTDLVKELKEYTSERKAGGTQDFDIQKVEPGNIDQCHILVIGASESTNIEQIAKSIEQKPILLITEKPDLISKGAGISFVKIEGVWKFQYKEENIKKAGIKISLDFKELGISI